MEGDVDVLGHARGVAADVEVRAGLEPGVEFDRVLEHAVLDVHLFRLVAGEGDVEPREIAGGLQFAQLILVEKVARGLLVAEEEPVLALGVGGAAFGEERAEGRDAGAGTDHDHRQVAIGRRAEGLVRVDEDADLAGGERALGEEGGADPLARAAVLVVAHGADRQVNLARMGLGRGRDRVEPRPDLFQLGHEFGGRGFDRRGEQHVDDVVGRGI